MAQVEPKAKGGDGGDATAGGGLRAVFRSKKPPGAGAGALVAKRDHFQLSLAGFAVTALWLIISLVYVFNRADGAVLMELPLHEAALVALGVILPPAAFWLMLLYFRRGGEFAEHRRALEEQLDRLTYLDRQANERIREVTESLKHQSDELFRASSVAVERIRDADELLRQRSNQLWQASDSAQARASTFADDLSERIDDIRDSLTQITAPSNDVAKELKSQLEDLGARFEDLDRIGSQAEARLDGMRNALADALSQGQGLLDELEARGDALKQGAELALSGTKAAQELLGGDLDGLQQIAAEIAGGTSRLQEAINAANTLLSGAGEQFSARAGQLSVTAEETARSLDASAQRAEERTRSLAEVAQGMEDSAREVAQSVRIARTQMNEFGASFTEKAVDITAKAGATRAAIDQSIETLHEHSEQFQTAADLAKAEAEALNDTFTHHTAMLDDAAERATRQAGELGDSLDQRTRALDDVSLRLEQKGGELAARLGDTKGLVDGLGAGLFERVAEAEDQFRRLSESVTASSREAVDELAAALAKLESGRDEVMTAGDIAVGVYDRVNEALKSNAEFMTKSMAEAGALADRMDAVGETLTAKLGDVGARLDERLGFVTNARESLEEAISGIGEAAERELARAQEVGAKLRGEVEGLDQAGAGLQSRVDAVAEQIGAHTRGFKEAGDLLLSRLSDADGLDVDVAQIVATIETALGQIDQLATGVRARTDEMDAAAKRSADIAELFVQVVGRQANELIAASEKAAEQTQAVYDRHAAARRQSFMRDLTFITERLNSLSVDLSRAIERNVPSGAFKRYMKGDRSIFTRGLLQRGDKFSLTAIKNHYQDEPEFRDHVNRYIAQFEEAMEQAEQNDPDDIISATLLSSDVGKLYLLISRALERIR